MEIIYIEGDSLAFKTFIHAQGGNASLRGIDGKNRWVIREDDGTEYVARPEEAQENEKNN